MRSRKKRSRKVRYRWHPRQPCADALALQMILPRSVNRLTGSTKQSRRRRLNVRNVKRAAVRERPKRPSQGKTKATKAEAREKPKNWMRRAAGLCWFQRSKMLHASLG